MFGYFHCQELLLLFELSQVHGSFFSLYTYFDPRGILFELSSISCVNFNTLISMDRYPRNSSNTRNLTSFKSNYSILGRTCDDDPMVLQGNKQVSFSEYKTP